MLATALALCLAVHKFTLIAEAQKRSGIKEFDAMQVAAMETTPELRKAHRMGVIYAYKNDDNRVPAREVASIAQYACENPE